MVLILTNKVKEGVIMLLNPETQVEKFIESMYQSFSSDNDMQEVFRKHYRSGYCWHFAHMLKDTFARGEVCWAAPFGHFVFVDTDGNPYDCEGIYEGEAFYFIPEPYMPIIALRDFKHVPDVTADINADIIISIIQTYCQATNQAYDPRLEKYIGN